MSEGQTIRGQALWADGASEVPLPFALTQVFGEDGQFLGQALADENGVFALQVDLGAYGATR